MDYQLIDVFKKAIPPLQEIERNCDELQRIQSQINQLNAETCYACILLSDVAHIPNL